ncbi:MAG: hypothetical protein RLZZ129_1891 [Verrucomicrobiota bacterium]|jgi:hypothetical protein
MVGFAALLCADAQAQQPAAPGQIKAARVTGSVSATKDGVTIAVTRGTELSQGYVINTAKNSSVVLVFSNGATMNLAQETSLAIDEFTQDPFADEISVAQLTAEPSASRTRLNLSRGELVGNVKKLNYDAGSSFEVQTPVGAAGIRGTTFRLVFRPDGSGKAFFSLTTLEGNVVLASGSVNLPTETSVPDNKEIEVIFDVTQDPVTGAISVVVDGAPPIVVRDAPPTTLAQMVQTMQQITAAVIEIAVTPPRTETPPPSDGAPPRTTPGDGRG